MQETGKIVDIETYFNSLSQFEKVGLQVWPSIEGESLTLDERTALRKFKPSGVILFSRNLKTLQQSKQLIQDIRDELDNGSRPFPTVICIDQEGGRVSRLPTVPRGEPAAAFAEPCREVKLREQARLQALVAKGLGINCFLAPVVDVLGCQNNAVIGDRAYSHVPQTVLRNAKAFCEVLHEEAILSCPKHFPGHGHTVEDSHSDFPISQKTEKELLECDWIPFSGMIQAGVKAIMTAHILFQKIDKNNPATLSQVLLKETLRKKLGFSGLILSDDLRMKAIALHMGVTSGEFSGLQTSQFSCKSQNEDWYNTAALKALQSGCDILVCSFSITREWDMMNFLAERGCGFSREGLNRLVASIPQG